MSGIRRENARPGAGAIKTQSGKSRNLERGRRANIGFLDTDQVNGMGRKKLYQFSAPGSKTSSISLKNLERVWGGEAEGVKEQPGARGSGEEAEEENTKWADGGREV